MNKFVKLLVIFLVNFIILSVLYGSIVSYIKKDMFYDPEFLIWKHKAINNEGIDISGYDTESFPDDFVSLELNLETYEKFCGEKRFEFGREYTSKPIVIFGCSYVYGHGLNIDETFPYILSKITQKPIYSYSQCGGILDINFNDKENEKNIENADYVIYLYMYEHVKRYLIIKYIVDQYNEIFPTGRAERIINKLFLVRYFKAKKKQKEIFLHTDKSAKYFKNIIIKWYKKTKAIIPNAKYIIIIYDEKLPRDILAYDEIIFFHKIMNSNIWSELEKETDGNIKVVHTKDITGFTFDKNYKLKEDISNWHPNAKAWETFTPLFAKQYIKN